MATLISSALGVDRKRLEGLGVFNGFVDVDSKLYVDPFLLGSASTPELAGADETFTKYFEAILKVLKASSAEDDVFMQTATRLLTFPEVATAGLGFSARGRVGSGIGPELAEKLAATARAIVKAGISDPDLFQLVGLFQENIGPDRISDMTIRVVFRHLAEFSLRVAKEVGAPTKAHGVDGTDYELPYYAALDSSFLLIPTELLRSLPVAFSWSDLDMVAAENAELRKRVNAKIGDTWKEATNDHKKRDLRQALVENPALVTDLLKQYRDKTASPYDLRKDPEGHVIWLDLAQDLVEQFPVDFAKPIALDSEGLLGVVRQLCEHYASLIEDNGLAKLLWADDGSVRHERFAQMLFLASSSLYCKKANLDISPESDAGRGPVDFKFSRGSNAKVTVEVKYSKNRVRHGYETQLPIYNRAEGTDHSILMVLRVTTSVAQIREIQGLRREALNRGERAPEVIVVDARIKPSASKA